jgi:hypothetical protein
MLGWPALNRHSQPCCVPIIAISTLDSSVTYTYLCDFENSSGSPGSSCPPGTGSADGDGVLTPIASDISKYNADRALIVSSLTSYGAAWPLAASEIIGKFKRWAGVVRAVVAAGQPLPQDSYGDMEFVLSGTSATARISLTDLQNLFQTLYNKHFPGMDNNQFATFLFDEDSSGSITVSQWPASVKTAFLNWIASTYPHVRVREFTITNYLVDGEDWIRRLNDHYLDTVVNGN